MSYVAVGLAIWRRCGARAFAVALLPWFPWLVLAALLTIGTAIEPDAESRRSVAVGWLFLTMSVAPFADQVLAVWVLRRERARRMNVDPGSLREPGVTGSTLLVALLITVVLAAAGTTLLLPMLLVAPFIYVTALVVAAERRTVRAALRRATRLSAGFRWNITYAMLTLWAIRWAVTAAPLLLPREGGPAAAATAIAATALVNVALSGLFAATQVAFYQRMVQHHDTIEAVFE